MEKLTLDLESLLVRGPAYEWLEEWWNSMSEEERLEARQEAEWYESLTEAERDVLWNQGDEELKQWLDSGTDDDDDDDDLADAAIDFAQPEPSSKRAVP